MSSRLVRLGVVVGLASLLAAAMAAGQSPGGVGGEARGVPVFNPVDGRVRVLSARPEGARVEKGEVVCELDAAALRDRIDSQEIEVQALRAGIQGARLAREAAAIELSAYKEGPYARELQAAMATVKMAETELVRNEDKLEWATRMFAKGYVSKAEKVAQELAFEKAKYALEEAQTARQVLERLTRDRTARVMMAAVENARERELKKTAKLKRAEVALKSLHDQINGCKVAAPVAGRVRYEATIGPGAVIRDGQIVFRIVPDAAPSDAAK